MPSQGRESLAGKPRLSRMGHLHDVFEAALVRIGALPYDSRDSLPSEEQQLAELGISWATDAAYDAQLAQELARARLQHQPNPWCPHLRSAGDSVGPLGCCSSELGDACRTDSPSKRLSSSRVFGTGACRGRAGLSRGARKYQASLTKTPSMEQWDRAHLRQKTRVETIDPARETSNPGCIASGIAGLACCCDRS